jgi:hypothetical protein
MLITLGGIHEMDPPLCGSAVISHTEISETDHSTRARRTSPMQHELRTVAIDLAKALVGFQGRGFADGVQSDFCHALLREALFFNSLKSE